MLFENETGIGPISALIWHKCRCQPVHIRSPDMGHAFIDRSPSSPSWHTTTPAGTGPASTSPRPAPNAERNARSPSSPPRDVPSTAGTATGRYSPSADPSANPDSECLVHAAKPLKIPNFPLKKNVPRRGLKCLIQASFLPALGPADWSYTDTTSKVHTALAWRPTLLRMAFIWSTMAPDEMRSLTVTWIS